MVENLAKYIDQTLLRHDCTYQEMKAFVLNAKQKHFHAVCIAPIWLDFVKKELSNSGIKIATAISFPLGIATTKTKKYEVHDAIERGTDEIDFVIDLPALKAKHYKKVLTDINEVAYVIAKKAILKVIIEIDVLTLEEKYKVCELVKETNANFLVTATGFWGLEPKVSDIELIRSIIPTKMGIKANGAIRTIDLAASLIAAGANRLGTPYGVEIVDDNTVYENNMKSENFNLEK